MLAQTLKPRTTRWLGVQLERIPKEHEISAKDWSHWCQQRELDPLGPGGRRAWINVLSSYMRDADYLVYRGDTLIDICCEDTLQDTPRPDPDDLTGTLPASFSSLFECNTTPTGDLQVFTPLIQSDGSMVDVFVVATETGWAVTDHADSIGMFRILYAPDQNLTLAQNRMIKETCATLGVEMRGHKLYVECADVDSLPEAVCRVAQAIVQINHDPEQWQRLDD